ncbi:MAG: hypothetical protein AB8H47_18065 [Bacteroidia bacterium]
MKDGLCTTDLSASLLTQWIKITLVLFRIRNQSDKDHYLAETKPRLTEWENQFDSYVSMRKALVSLSEEEKQIIGTRGLNQHQSQFMKIVTDELDEKVAQRVVDRLYESTLINQFGIIQIADSVYKYYPSQVAKFKYQDESEVEKIQFSGVNDLPTRAVLEDREQRVLVNQTTTRGGNNLCTYDYENGNRDQRFRCRLEYDKKGVTIELPDGTKVVQEFYEFTASIKHQRRSALIWWPRNAPQMRVVVTGNTTFCNVNSTVNEDSGIVFGDNELEDIVASGQYCGVLDDWYLEGEHFNVGEGTNPDPVSGVNRGWPQDCGTNDWD